MILALNEWTCIWVRGDLSTARGFLYRGPFRCDFLFPRVLCSRRSRFSAFQAPKTMASRAQPLFERRQLEQSFGGNCGEESAGKLIHEVAFGTVETDSVSSRTRHASSHKARISGRQQEFTTSQTTSRSRASSRRATRTGGVLSPVLFSDPFRLSHGRAHLACSPAPECPALGSSGDSVWQHLALHCIKFVSSASLMAAPMMCE